MAWHFWFWIVACPWLGFGVCLVVVVVAAEVSSAPPMMRHQRLREMMRRLPQLAPLAIFCWPFLVAIAIYQTRREVVFSRIGLTHLPSFSGCDTSLTEQEWLKGRNPANLLQRLAKRISLRQQRLFACACCRRLWSRLDPRSRRAVEVAERRAEDAATVQEIRSACSEAGAAIASVWDDGDLQRRAAARACQDCLIGNSSGAAEWAAHALFHARQVERDHQFEMLREIVGNPFRPLRDRPFPPEIRELARACHEGDHRLYPLLADALDELDEPEAAAHCRRSAHLRGCHVVAWVLGYQVIQEAGGKGSCS